MDNELGSFKFNRTMTINGLIKLLEDVKASGTLEYANLSVESRGAFCDINCEFKISNVLKSKSLHLLQED